MKRVLCSTPDDAAIQLSYLNWDTVAIDFETTDVKYDKLKVQGFSVCDGNVVVYCDTCLLPEHLIIMDILRMLLNNTRVIVAHNIVFEGKVLHKYGIDVTNKEWFDTMVAHHLIDETSEHGLKHLAETILDKEVVSYEEISKDGPHTKKFYNYGCDDAEWTWNLAIIFKEQLEDQDLVHLFREIEMPFLKTLVEMEVNGILIDQKRVSKITRQLQEEVVRLETAMLDVLEEKYTMQLCLGSSVPKIVSNINLSSPAQLQKILYSRYNFEPVLDPKTKHITVGKEFMQLHKHELGDEITYDHPFIELLDKYKIASKLLKAFFEPMPEYLDSDGRIRPSFRDTGTKTGRLSCSEPNIQQLPKKTKAFDINTRSCFIAPEGKLLIAADYSQQELRIMAELSQDETLIKIILEGGDIHLINANAVFNLGIPLEDMITSSPNYKSTKKKYSKERDRGKIFSFGIGYGMTEHKLARDFSVSIDEAKKLLNNYWEGYPSLKKAVDNTIQKVNRDGWVSTYTGRRRRFEKNSRGFVDNKANRQSFNFLIQSYGADLIRMACIKIKHYSMVNPEYEIKLLMTIHDEIVMEVKEDYSEIVATEIENLMKSCAQMVVPLLSEASVAKDYGSCK